MWSKTLAVIAIVAVVAVPEALAQPGVTHSIELEVGQQHSISAKGVAKYSEGVKGIIDVRLPDDGSEFIVVGIRPGVTTLLLIDEAGGKTTYTFVVKALGNEVPERENIRLDFYFVELSDSGQHRVGIAWPSSIGVGAAFNASVDLSAGTLTAATASVAGHPLPRLDMLQTTGWAKVTRQASLVTSNGKEAELRSGGEVNIAVQGSLAAELRQIPFGTRVKVFPRYDRETGRLELRVDAEVSSLGQGEVPSRNVSTVRSVVNVGMNQAIVLAGLQSHDHASDVEGIPVLSQIPVLGRLFGTRSVRQQSVQNVVFIVPSVVDVVGMDARRQIQKSLDIYRDYEGELDSVQLLSIGGK